MSPKKFREVGILAHGILLSLKLKLKLAMLCLSRPLATAHRTVSVSRPRQKGLASFFSGVRRAAPTPFSLPSIVQYYTKLLIDWLYQKLRSRNHNKYRARYGGG